METFLKNSISVKYTYRTRNVHLHTRLVLVDVQSEIATYYCLLLNLQNTIIRGCAHLLRCVSLFHIQILIDLLYNFVFLKVSIKLTSLINEIF